MMAKIRKYDNCGSCERVRERERERERGGRREGHHCRLSVVTGLCCKRLCMPACVCLTGCEGGLQAAFVIASQLSCGPQLVDGIQSVCPVCLSVCFPMRLTVRLPTSHSPSLSLPSFPSLFLPLCPVLFVIFHMQFLEIFRIRNICRHGKETCRLQQHQA